MAPDKEKEPENRPINRIRSFLTPPGTQQGKKDGLPPKAHFSIWYFVIMMLLILYLQQYLLSPKVETIPYSRFKQEVAQGNIEKLTIAPDNITGTLKAKDKKPAEQFVTVRVDDPGLVKDLDDHKIDYSGRYESKFLSSLLSWILPPSLWNFSGLLRNSTTSWSSSFASSIPATSEKVTFGSFSAKTLALLLANDMTPMPGPIFLMA